MLCCVRRFSFAFNRGWTFGAAFKTFSIFGTQLFASATRLMRFHSLPPSEMKSSYELATGSAVVSSSNSASVTVHLRSAKVLRCSRKSRISIFLFGIVKDTPLVVRVVKLCAKWDGTLPESKEYLAGSHHTDGRSDEIDPEGVPVAGVKS